MNKSVFGFIAVYAALLIVVLVVLWPKPLSTPGTNTTTNNNNSTNTNNPPPLVGVYTNSSSNDIVATSITPVNTTTVQIMGQALGGWYFEATFPVEIKDQFGNVIGNGIAEAQADWMTSSSVPFMTVITLNTPYSGTATVILHKDNPSGLPENEASVSYAITL